MPLTIISPPVRDELVVLCGDKIADPLTTGDQYDLARALAQAIDYGKTCGPRQAALVDAVKTRDALMKSVQQQLKK